MHKKKGLNDLAQSYIDALLSKDRNEAEKVIVSALETGTPIRDIYLDVFQQTQIEIGKLWQSNKISVAMEHYCTAATQLIMSRLYEHIFSSHKNGKNLVATSISGELHELGIRMVSDFFEMEGWNTYYLGANTPKMAVVDMIKETSADVLAISATIYFNIPQVKELINYVKKNTEEYNVKIIVGGRVFNAYPELWKEVKADGFARDADGAIEIADRLVLNK